jgi:choline dehydrogenase-like flavoprotein
MGKESDELAVVDNEFKVRGVKGLRVVDHAATPLMAIITRSALAT